MSSVRRMSTQRLLALAGGLAALVAAAAVLASSALSSGGAVPPARPLAVAVRNALTAPPVPGLSARIAFTDKLVDSSSLPTGSPLLKGAKGRLWASRDGRARLELQSPGGDAQIVLAPDRITLYDQGSNTVYEARLPARDAAKADSGRVPTLAGIQRRLTEAMGRLQISGAMPSNVNGIAAYTVRIAPRHDGGLVGAAEVAWDAATGVPLRAALYAQGSAKPVLELTITDLNYGTVSAQDLTATPPAGAKVTTIDLTRGARARHTGRASSRLRIAGLKAVGAAVPFSLSAPATLVGLPRQGVRLVRTGDGTRGALVTYGRGLGGIAVLQTAVGRTAAPGTAGRAHDRGTAGLPRISVNGVTGQELATALGTIVRFDRGGVRYVVAGSVPPAAAEAAARGL